MIYDKYLQFSKASSSYLNHLRQYSRLGILIFLIFTVILRHYHVLKLLESRYPPKYLTKENQENLDIISFIKQNIPLNAALIAPIEIGPWLNASGYSVWNIWLNASTPDWVVRDYIESYSPSYLILPKDYLYIPQGLGYASMHGFANYEIFEQIALPLFYSGKLLLINS